MKNKKPNFKDTPEWEKIQEYLAWKKEIESLPIRVTFIKDRRIPDDLTGRAARKARARLKEGKTFAEMRKIPNDLLAHSRAARKAKARLEQQKKDKEKDNV